METRRFTGVLIAALLVGGCLGGGAAGVKNVLSGNESTTELIKQAPNTLTASASMADITSTTTLSTTSPATALIISTSSAAASANPSSSISGSQGVASVSGSVQSVKGSVIAIKVSDGTLSTISTTGTTLIQKSFQASLADLKTGVSVTVGGSQQGDGSLLAESITINVSAGAAPTQAPISIANGPPTGQTGVTPTQTPPLPGSTSPRLPGTGSPSGGQGMAGTIQTIDGGTITLRLSNGITARVIVSASTAIKRVSPGALTDIAAGSNINITGMPQSDGSIRATIITIE